MQGKVAADLLKQREAAVAVMEGLLEEQGGLVSSIEAKLAASSRYTTEREYASLWLSCTRGYHVVSAEGHARSI